MAKLKELKELLLGLPEEAFDPSLHDVVKSWDEVPTPLQVLWVLDQCVMCGLAAPMVVWALNHALSMSIVSNNTTYADVIKTAYWRDPQGGGHEVQ